MVALRNLRGSKGYKDTVSACAANKTPFQATLMGKAETGIVQAIADLTPPAPAPAPAGWSSLWTSAKTVWVGAETRPEFIQGRVDYIAALAQLLARRGYDLAIKAHHGAQPSPPQFLDAAVAAARAAGVRVELWGWVGDDEPAQEASTASSLIDRHKPAGYGANLEKDSDARAEVLWKSRDWCREFRLRQPSLPLAGVFLGGAALPAGVQFTPWTQPVDWPAWVAAAADLYFEAFWDLSPGYRPSNTVHMAVANAKLDPARVHLMYEGYAATNVPSACEAELRQAEQAGLVPRTSSRALFLGDNDLALDSPQWTVLG